MELDNLLIECRQEGEQLRGLILTEGRAAAGGRRELFAPGSVVWPADGIALLDGHGGDRLAQVYPARHGNEIRIATPVTDRIRQAVESGKAKMSIEFRSLQEQTTAGGVREVLRAVVHAAALVASPEYTQTSAEIRTKDRRRWLLL